MAETYDHQVLINLNRKIMGISNTYLLGQPWLSHVEKDLKKFLNPIKKIVIIPYALDDMDAYASMLYEAFNKMGINDIVSIHSKPGEEVATIESAESIFIAGGNTLRLLCNLHALKKADGTLVDIRKAACRQSVITAIRKRVAAGMPIIGSSAGLNVFCSEVRTTNDMHIAIIKLEGGESVSRIDALGLLPQNLSVNPHFQDKISLSLEERELIPGSIKQKILSIVDHQGESRLERLRQVVEMDRERTILALREGAYFIVRGMQFTIKGTTGGLIVKYGKEEKEVKSEDNLNDLLS